MPETTEIPEHISLVCRLQFDRDHEECSGGCDRGLTKGHQFNCNAHCECWCHQRYEPTGKGWWHVGEAKED